MNISAAKTQIKDTVEAYLKKDEAGMYIISPHHQRPVFLIGAPGIGKTAIMEQVAHELGIGLVSYSMTHHTRQSALGLPRIEHREFEGVEYEASEYTMSEIIASIYEYMQRSEVKSGILFLDEINCVSETLYPSMLQFLQFKTFGKHRVPEDWVVVCAGNPPEYNRSVHDFDIVTLDRLRQIEVVPEYGCWKTYAQTKGIHPVVTTFLEARQECFYKVESRPGGGKSFVTARGWDDLASIITVYEKMDKPINRELIVQFLQDDDIADMFGIYYKLFQKYRSDYQVAQILSGEVSDSIIDRARDAEFDERVALIGLLVDSIGTECKKTLDQEDLAIALRDVLREAKPELLCGGTVEKSIHERVIERERTLNRRVEAGLLSEGAIRKERMVILKLRDIMGACAVAQTTGGDMAFRTVQVEYQKEVDKINALAQDASEKIDYVFDFMDRAMSSREVLVFVAELTTRGATTKFIAHYGNDKYYAHNKELQVDASRMGLDDRLAMLGNIDALPADKRDVAQGGLTGLRKTSAPRDEEVLGVVGGTGKSEGAGAGGSAASGASAQAAGGEASDGTGVDADAAGGEASGATSAPDADMQLVRYYSGKQFEWGFAALCKMSIAASDCKGKRVLDVGCRRGKGVYKLSAFCGAAGSVTGIDWTPSYIEEAKRGMKRAWQENGLKKNNMEFKLAFPEDLMSAGFGNETFDVIYINNVLTLLFDQEQAIAEFGRILRPGGLLVAETVFSDMPRKEDIVDAAKHIGNSIQAAKTKEENFFWLERAGFEGIEIRNKYKVRPERGFVETGTVDTVPSDEKLTFSAVTLYCKKK